MRLLAIDTALNACSVAVLDDTRDGEGICSASDQMGRGHAERLMTMIGEVLADSELCFADLDRIVATVGPGSFTGVRVGLSTARGLGLVLDKPVVGVTTLAALADEALRTTSLPVAAVIDARRGEVYHQVFCEDGPVTEPVVESVNELVGRLPERCALIGSASEPVAVAAAEAGRHTIVVSAAGAPSIAAVARLGAITTIPESPPAPLYLRAPDAKPQTGAQIARV